MSQSPLYTDLEFWKRYFKTAFKWVILSLLIAIPSGLLGAAFYQAIAAVTALRMAHQWILLLLPLIGVIIVFIYQKLGAMGLGTDYIIDCVISGESMKPNLLPAIFAGTVLTHLGGGSAGREGAALQIGGQIGNLMAQLFHLDARDRKAATLVGMSAFFSALFGTPLTAAIFVVMFVRVGSIYQMVLLPCYIGSTAAFHIAKRLGVSGFSFTVDIPEATPVNLVAVFAVAILTSIVSMLFVHTLKLAGKGFARLFKNPYLRVIAGGLIIIVLTLIVSGGHLSCDYNGAGGEIIAAAAGGQALWYAWIMKILFTAVTIESGYKGGEIVPTFFIGAVFGCWAAPVFGLPASFGAALGMTALFGAVTNTMIAPVVFAAEAFGGGGLHMFALAAFTAFILSGYSGLYSSQRITWSKVDPMSRISIEANDLPDRE